MASPPASRLPPTAHLLLLLATGNPAKFSENLTINQILMCHVMSTPFPSHTSYLHHPLSLPSPSFPFPSSLFLPPPSIFHPSFIVAHTHFSFICYRAPLPSLILATGTVARVAMKGSMLASCHIYTHLPHDFQSVTARWQTHEEINNWKM